jgi:hypothetical protein
MKIPAPPRLRHVNAAQSLARRTLLLCLGGAALFLAACASTSRSSERYVVLESQKFT